MHKYIQPIKRQMSCEYFDQGNIEVISPLVLS